MQTDDGHFVWLVTVSVLVFFQEAVSIFSVCVSECEDDFRGEH